MTCKWDVNTKDGEARIAMPSCTYQIWLGEVAINVKDTFRYCPYCGKKVLFK